MAKKVFEKGKPKTGGRAKGTPNKKTAEANEILHRAMMELSGTLEDDVKAVNASRRLQLLTDLFNYAKPKLSSTTNKNDDSVSHSGEIRIVFEGSNPFESDAKDE
jgi:hypothetical protein